MSVLEVVVFALEMIGTVVFRRSGWNRKRPGLFWNTGFVDDHSGGRRHAARSDFGQDTAKYVP